jgi:hypothetical protein
MTAKTFDVTVWTAALRKAFKRLFDTRSGDRTR